MSLPLSAPLPNNLSSWQLGAPVEIQKPALNLLRSLGHKLERFLAARITVHRKVHVEPTLAALRPWLPTENDRPASLEGDGTFAVALDVSAHKFTVSEMLLPMENLEACLHIWRQVEPEASKVLTAPLSPPPDAAAPRWAALLRLRPLRPVWESVLRRDHFEPLLELLPDAWLLDPAPVPHGGVIPRLDVPSWDALAVRLESSHPSPDDEEPSLTVVPAGTTGPAGREHSRATSTLLRQAISSFPSEPHVLVQAPLTTERTLIVSFYEKKGSRVDHRGLLALAGPQSGGWQASRVRQA